jgi:hypothetical protein
MLSRVLKILPASLSNFSNIFEFRKNGRSFVGPKEGEVSSRSCAYLLPLRQAARSLFGVSLRGKKGKDDSEIFSPIGQGLEL